MNTLIGLTCNSVATLVVKMIGEGLIQTMTLSLWVAQHVSNGHCAGQLTP